MNGHCKKHGHAKVSFDVPLDAHSYIPKGRCFWCGSPAQYKSAQHSVQPTGGTSRQKSVSKRKANTVKKVSPPTSG